jgi:hypothetical protein
MMMYDSDIEVGSNDAAMWRAECQRWRADKDEWRATAMRWMAEADRLQEELDSMEDRLHAATAELAALREPAQVDHLADANMVLADGAPAESVMCFTFISIAESLKTLASCVSDHDATYFSLRVQG